MFAQDPGRGDSGTIERCGSGQSALAIGGAAESHRFRSQFPVFAMPSRPPRSEAPAKGDDGAGPSLRRFHFPAFVRRAIGNIIERRDPRYGALTGQPHDPVRDPEGRGAGIRGAHSNAAGMRNAGDILTNGQDHDPAIVADMSETGDAIGPDITVQIQSTDSEQHEALRSARASFPGLQVSPVPQTRMVVIAAQSTSVDIPLPSGAVFCRISWSGRYSGVDLVVSTIGAASGVFTAAANGNPSGNDGLFINPNPDTNLYCKGKLSLSVMVPASSVVFANPTLVTIECYMNN